MSKKKEEIKEDLVESVTYKDVTFKCPKRGLVTQKVKIVKYKSKQVENKDFIKSSDKFVNDFNMSDITGQDLDDIGDIND